MKLRETLLCLWDRVATDNEPLCGPGGLCASGESPCANHGMCMYRIHRCMFFGLGRRPAGCYPVCGWLGHVADRHLRSLESTPIPPPMAFDVICIILGYLSIMNAIRGGGCGWSHHTATDTTWGVAESEWCQSRYGCDRLSTRVNFK